MHLVFLFSNNNSTCRAEVANEICFLWRDITNWWLRQHLYGTESVWNQYEIGNEKPCVTQDLVDPILIESAIWYQLGPLMKLIPDGAILFYLYCKQSGPYHKGSDLKRMWTHLMQYKPSLNVIKWEIGKAFILLHNSSCLWYRQAWMKWNGYSTYTERRSASENCTTDNLHWIVFSS